MANVYVTYDEAVAAMMRGLKRYMPQERALRFARVFADNSMDGVYSHGMNRYPRYLSDMASGLCDATVEQAERVSGFGGMEVWDAHFGIGPLMAEQAVQRVIELAREHGIACVGLRNNSHWLRAGRFGLMMADAGFAGICFTNTCQNLTAYGAKQAAIGNNPITLAIPRKSGSLMMDMAVSQYAYGKLELMAQAGKRLPTVCGYDKDGNPTDDPAKIIESGLMLPFALWKGNALSIMLDLMAAMLTRGRTALEIGEPAAGEKGLSNVFICMHPAALGDMTEIEEKMQRTMEFLHALEGDGVHAPGENLAQKRKEHAENGIPVAEETWKKILAAEE